MHSKRFFSLVAALLLLAAASSAEIIKDPGTYDANVVIDTSIFPMPGLPEAGPNIYWGEVIISHRGFGYSVRFVGETMDGLPLDIRSRFSSEWLGLMLTPVTVGGEVVPDVVTQLDGAHLLGMNIRGTGTVDGWTQRVVATLGPEGEIRQFKILRP